MAKQPLAEVFGFPIDNISAEAKRHRANRLCPFNNKVPNCTKDKANDPLGVCSVYESGRAVITCPVRLREKWLIADAAAGFFFPPETRWTSLTEVRLTDKHGRSAGNVDIILVSYDESGRLLDFGALEVQSVYISGNVRRPFEYYMADPDNRGQMDWTGQRFYPRPDYLSSSIKRLVPQLIYKGGILTKWRKKMAVAVDRPFFSTLPELPRTTCEEADTVLLVYNLAHDATTNLLSLVPSEIVYTLLAPTLQRLTTLEAGEVDFFVGRLQDKLDDKLGGVSPDASTLMEYFEGQNEE